MAVKMMNAWVRGAPRRSSLQINYTKYKFWQGLHFDLLQTIEPQVGVEPTT